jgi:hypothetical protein
MNLDFIRGIVRPVVTVSLVGAAVAAVFTGRLEAEWLAGVASITVVWWFKDRSDEKRP